MKKSQTVLQDLFLDSLADIYYAENKLTRALPKMVKAATHDDLRQAFESHLEETEGHVEKVGKVFAAFGEKAKSKTCPAIDGLLKEADEVAADNKGSATINAALIAAGQKVEHYEIATYGCLHEWADVLGNEKATSLLGEILEEEKAADTALTELARDRCNSAAQNGAASEAGDDKRSKPSERARLSSRRVRPRENRPQLSRT